jgi:hypothetical protein
VSQGTNGVFGPSRSGHKRSGEFQVCCVAGRNDSLHLGLGFDVLLPRPIDSTFVHVGHVSGFDFIGMQIDVYSRVFVGFVQHRLNVLSILSGTLRGALGSCCELLITDGGMLECRDRASVGVVSGISAGAFPLGELAYRVGFLSCVSRTGGTGAGGVRNLLV